MSDISYDGSVDDLVTVDGNLEVVSSISSFDDDLENSVKVNSCDSSLLNQFEDVGSNEVNSIDVDTTGLPVHDNEGAISERVVDSDSDEQVDFDHMLPLLRTENNSVTKSALLYYWQITSKISDVALSRLLKMLSVICPEKDFPASVKAIKSQTQHLFGGRIAERKTERIDDTLILIVDLEVQLNILISQFHEVIIEYCNILKSTSNTDILNSKCMRNVRWNCCTKSVDLFFLASADGASFTTSTNLDIWPFQLVVLNLPPTLRHKKENILLFGLMSSHGKPSLKKCIPKLMEYLPRVVLVNDIIVNIHVKFFVCDLPALATIFNLKQFNGKFSCPKCLNPGRRASNAKVWIFPQVDVNIPMRNDETHVKHVAVAVNGVSIFGVKGRSCLEGFVNFPSGNPVDTMHCLFEGQVKFILQCFTDVKLKHLPCFLMPVQVKRVTETLMSLKLPLEYSYEKNICHLSIWKAKELKFFSLHLLLPVIIPNTSNFLLQQTLFILTAIYHLLYCEHSDKNTIQELVEIFFEIAPIVFSDSILRLNFHFLCHIVEQYESFGPVYLTSMFPFESMIKVYKSFVFGSKCFAEQICEKFLRFKVLSHFLQKVDNEVISSAYDCINLSQRLLHAKRNTVISDGVANWKGKALHSLSYDEKLKSNCSYVQLKNGVVGLIKGFVFPDQVTVIPLIEEDRNLFDCFVQTSDRNYEKYRAIVTRASNLCETYNFKLFDLAAQKVPVLTKLEDVRFRCVVVKITDRKSCIIPLIEVNEHD